MANFKKGIALALVATTAFTFAPVANLGTPVVAEAASALVKAEDITLVTGEKKTYTVQDLAKYADGSTVTVKSSDKTIARFSAVADHTGAEGGDHVATISDKIGGEGADQDFGGTVSNLEATDTFTVDAAKAGTATITVTVENTNGAVTTETFAVTVVAKAASVSASATVDGKTVDATKGLTLGTASGVVTVTLTSKNIADNAWTVMNVGNPTNAAEGKFTAEITAGASTASATLTLTPGTVAESGSVIVTNGSSTLIIPVTVAKNSQSLTVKYDADGDGIADVATDKVNNRTGEAPSDGKADQILYLDDVTKTAKIEATSDFGANVTFKSDNALVVVDNAGNVALNGVPATDEVDAVITVTATATTINGAAVAPVTLDVPVKVSKKAQTIASVKNSAGKVIASGRNTTVKNVTENYDAPAGAIVLSLKDKVTDSIVVSSNVGDAYTYGASSDTKVVTYANGVLTAVGKGTANITITVKNSVATTGTLEFTIPVKVVDVNAKEVISTTVESVSLNKTTTTAQLSATTTYGSAVAYSLVEYKEATKTYVPYTAGDVVVNPVTGFLTYVNQNKSGSVFIELSTPAHANTELAADKVYVPLTFSAVKDASDLKAASVVTLKAGETGSVNATASGKLTYVSDNEAVATVSEDGTVTAVAAGTANITVSAEATEKFEAGKVVVPVVVTEEAKPVVIAKPAKVKSVTAKAVKGGKVKFTAKKVAKAAGYQFVYTVGKKTVKKTTTKTTLTVKIGKGKKATVKVRAYNYKNGTTKQYGAFSAKKSVKASK